MGRCVIRGRRHCRHIWEHEEVQRHSQRNQEPCQGEENILENIYLPRQDQLPVEPIQEGEDNIELQDAPRLDEPHEEDGQCVLLHQGTTIVEGSLRWIEHQRGLSQGVG